MTDRQAAPHRRLTVGLLLALTACTAAAAAAAAGEPGEPARAAAPVPSVSAPATSDRTEPPALMVAVVVDQLRGDLLPRYASAFTGGFARALRDGLLYTNAVHDHAHTETAAGHATIATGVTPSRHGIVANTWWRDDGDRWTLEYAVDDPQTTIVGAPDLAGSSPRNMLRDAFGDWLVAAHPEARVVSLSRKDRAAITMGGRSHDAHVFWIGAGTGRFVTSSWYKGGIPDWVARFNEEVMPRLYADSVWSGALAATEAQLSRPDTFQFEADGQHTSFPHRASVETPSPLWPDYDDWWMATPVPDTAVLALAERAVEALQLGGRSTTDYLALELSQTDAIGHTYGPLSREQLDNLMRLDRALGVFFDYLDRTVGAGRWALVLTADHGTADIPEWWNHEGLPAVRVTTEMRQQEVQAAGTAAQRAAGARAPVAVGLDNEKAQTAVVKALDRLKSVEQAMPLSQLVGDAPADSFVRLYRNSFHEGRRPNTRVGAFGADMRAPEYWVDKTFAGTTHGTPYYYDRWVPLLFMGPGIQAGRDSTRVRTVDVAPSLARWAGIAAPSDLDGQPVPALR